MDLSSIGTDITANITTIRLMNPENIDFNEYPNRGGVYATQMTVRFSHHFFNRSFVEMVIWILDRGRLTSRCSQSIFDGVWIR